MGVKENELFTLELPNLPSTAKKLRLVWIPPGTFTMGVLPEHLHEVNDFQGPFEVKISRGFWLGQFEVTQAQWTSVMGSNPSHFSNLGDDHPVENISWYQAMEFCLRLGELMHPDLPAQYQFSLPTEAQWEYVCRAGGTISYDDENALDGFSEVAWHQGNSENHTHPVGEKSPNTFEIYDMFGNVGEWCFDSPSDYPTTPVVDWINTGDGFVRNMRGGAYGTLPESVLSFCGARIWVSADERRPWFGMRLCLRSSANPNDV